LIIFDPFYGNFKRFYLKEVLDIFGIEKNIKEEKE